MSSQFRNPLSSFCFLHASTGLSWPVTDPVAWCLANAQSPILENARNRLVTLNDADPQRVIRLVVRRCGLNLLEVGPERVMVHFWGEKGQADLGAFLKLHGLARKDVQVVLLDRKRESIKVQTGDDFLFGKQLPANFLWDEVWAKWQCRYQDESDDRTAAPHTWSGFAWEGIEPNRIPWSALKSAWRRSTPFACLNCDEPAILINFGLPWVGLTNRVPRFHHLCWHCRRVFADESFQDVAKWIVTNIGAEDWPDYDLLWDRRINWLPPII